jgi:two-component sensor histidine kinase
MSRLLLLTILLVFFFQINVIHGQKPILTEYAIEQIKEIPEEKQDSFYIVQGKYYYAFYTRESYRKSMECYLEALRLAIKYKHSKEILRCYFYIGSVFDANNNVKQAVRYYTMYYDGVLKERPFNADNILRATYNIASIYTKSEDTTNAYLYTLKMAEMVTWVKTPKFRNQYYLLIAHNFVMIGRHKEFLEYFNKIPANATFEDGELAYGRYFAESKSRQAFFNGDYNSVIPPVLYELSRTKDSVSLMNFLIGSYADIGDYKSAYQTQKKTMEADWRSMDRNTYGDINYRLLEADNLLRQKRNSELMIADEQLKFRTSLLYASTFLMALGFAITFFLFRRYKIRNKLKDQKSKLNKEHEEASHLLLAELHSGINESLEALYASLDVQFQTSGQSIDDIKKEIKAGINCIALSHSILQQNEEISRVPLQPFFEKLTRETLEIFDAEACQIKWEVKTSSYYMEVARLIPLALAAVELLKNTVRNNVNCEKQVDIIISCMLSDGEYHFNYIEHTSAEPDLSSGVITRIDTTLLHNFLKQIDAKVMIDDSIDGKSEVLVVFNK